MGRGGAIIRCACAGMTTTRGSHMTTTRGSTFFVAAVFGLKGALFFIHTVSIAVAHPVESDCSDMMFSISS